MPTERATERADGATERTIYVDRGGSGVGGVIIAIAVLALVAVVAFFLMTQSRNEALTTSAVTGAASSVSQAADNVGAVASRAADQVAPSAPPSAPAPSAPQR